MKHEELIKKSADAAGKAAFAEIDVDDVDPDLAEHLGQLKTRTGSTPERENVLLHSLEVAHLSGLIAAELDLDVALAQRAGLLHDVGKSIADGRDHIRAGLDLCDQFGEHDIVRDVIASHHDKNDHLSPYTFAVKAADWLAAQKGLENHAPEVIHLASVSENHSDLDSAHAIHVLGEVWILIRGGKIDQEILEEEIKDVMHVEGKILVTFAKEMAA